MAALAVAYGPLALDLFAAHEIEADYLEVAGPLADEAATRAPGRRLLLHNSVFDWSLGHPAALTQRDVMVRTRHTLAITHAPWLSIHLGFSTAQVGFDGVMQARSPVLARDELLGRVCRNVRALARAIPVPLLLENLDYCPGGAYEHVCAPDFIAAVIAETGAGLLLDLAHAQVSAAGLGLPITDYLDHLPLERVCQLHVSGPRRRDGMLTDAHEPLSEEDYALLERVLRQTRPRALTLEYGRDAAALREQLVRLRPMLMLTQTPKPQTVKVVCPE